MNKVGNIIMCIVPLLIAIAIQIGVSFAGILVFGVTKAFQLAFHGETDPDVIAESIYSIINTDVVIILTGLAAAVCLVVFGIWYKKGFPDLTRKSLKDALTIKRVLLVVMMAIGIQFATSMILGGLESAKPEWFEKYNQLIDSLGMGESWISIIPVVFLAPIAEELIFRGVILQYTKKAMPFLAGNILQAALFGIYHMNIVQGLYAFLFGLFLGFVCEKFGSIYGAILLHMCINLLGYLIGLFLSEDVYNTPIMGIVIFIVSVLMIAFSVKMVYKENIETNSLLISE
jgi:membrane protease YdiL (CAAX protease family)